MPLAPELRAPLTKRFQQSIATISERTVPKLTKVWTNLGSIDESDIPTFTSGSAPSLSAAKHASVRSATGYYSLVAGVRPPAIRAADVAVEADLREPFISVWRALKSGNVYVDAVASGQARIDAVVRNFVTSTSRHTGDVVAERSGLKIVGWERATDGKACDWCRKVANGFYTSAASADFGHDRCGCSAVPLFSHSEGATIVDLGANEAEQVAEAVSRLSVEQREILARNYPQWGTGTRNTEARATLKATPEGKTLVRAVDQFQSTQGGVARFRNAVDDVVQGRGADLPVATRENAEALLDAMRTTTPDGKTLYRGLKVKGSIDDILAAYEEGSTVDLGMSSFSSNQTVANHFMKFGMKKGDVQISIRVETPQQALPLSNASKSKHHADLREYVAGGRFEVVSARKSGTNKISLLLRQVAGL